MQQPIISIRKLNKTYASGLRALRDIELEIYPGELFALLGPNGAGKTTLISTICGLVNPSQGKVCVGGYDIINDYRKARAMIGLVPQELSTDMFERVWDTVCFSRGLFGKPKDPDFIERLLRMLSLWDKRNTRIMALSGGMKRRLMIAKALSHEPNVLFLDEPTAGIDVERRNDMWEMVRDLCKSGVTIILTTHYIREAEELADRIGVINNGKIIVVEEKKKLIKKFGRRQLTLRLRTPLSEVPAGLNRYALDLVDDGSGLTYTFDAQQEDADNIATLVHDLDRHGIYFKDLYSSERSLEEIFISLVKEAQ